MQQTKWFFSPIHLLYSRNKLSDIQKILFIAMLFIGCMLFISNYVYDNDGYLFLQYLDALIKGPEGLNDPGIVRYDIAYPFLLWVSGYAFHHSLIGIALMNAIMALMIPLLIYFIVRPIFPKMAYYTALASVVSCASFFYIKWIRPDHAFTFFSMLSICWLVLFIDKKQIHYLYLMTFAVMLASLSRAAGNVMFPLFIVLAYLLGRGAIKHYVVCVLLVLCVTTLYGFHRAHYFSRFGNLYSFNGGQAFQNLYVNAPAFGVHLSPEQNPAMKEITDTLYLDMLPAPALSPAFQRGENDTDKAFFNTHVYPFGAKELAQRFYSEPNIIYFEMMYVAAKNDPVFFRAALYILKQHPFYPIKYTARNMWYLFYRPGHTHPRDASKPFVKIGKNDAFPFNKRSSDLKNLSPRAVKELQFDNLQQKPVFVKTFLNTIRNIFCATYDAATRIIFYLMVIAWIAALVSLISDYFSSEKLKRFARLLLPEKRDGWVVTAITLYLLQTMVIISAFVDPLFRFHNHLIPFKLILAGVGIGVLVNVLSRGLLRSMPSGAEAKYAELYDLKEKNYKLAGWLLVLFGISLFGSWAFYLWSHTT